MATLTAPCGLRVRARRRIIGPVPLPGWKTQLLGLLLALGACQSSPLITSVRDAGSAAMPTDEEQDGSVKPFSLDAWAGFPDVSYEARPVEKVLV